MNHFQAPSSLSAPIIQSLLRTDRIGQVLSIEKEVESTNMTATTLFRNGASHGTVVLAERQTSGRGRLGRQWFSPPNHNLYCSVILEVPSSSSQLSWLPLLTGMSIIESLHKELGIRLSLKWPNDIVIQSHKLGGVLCEGITDSRNRYCVVSGFGINVNMRKEDFPPELQDVATSLSIETGKIQDRNRLISSILAILAGNFTLLEKRYFETIRDCYLFLCSTIGQKIRVDLASGACLEGLAEDIGLDGALHIRPTLTETCFPSLENGIIKIRSGDIIHVR